MRTTQGSQDLSVRRTVSPLQSPTMAPIAVGLVGAGAVWWLSTVGASIAVGAQGLAWFDVLRNVPFDSVGRDVALLHERWFARAATGESTAWVHGVLLQLLVWRVLLLAPLGWVFANLRGSRRGGARLLARTIVQMPRFVGLTLFWQLTTGLLVVTVGGYGFGKLTTPTASAFEMVWGGLWLVLAAMGALVGLTLMDVSRLGLFHGPNTLPGTLRMAALNGLEALWRHPGRLLALTSGYWIVSTVAALGFGWGATYLAALAPGSWGLVISWLVMQAGVGAAMLVRVAGWRRVLHVLSKGRTVVG